MIISVICPDKESNSLLENDLVGIDSEILNTSWQQGVTEAQGQFLCYIDPDADYKPGYFVRGLLNMLIVPSYRKLAMVCPVTEDCVNNRSVYGFKVRDGFRAVTESDKKEPFVVHVGLMAGAIIRRSTLIKYDMYESEPDLQQSQDFCLKLWEDDMRIHVDPRMSYVVDELKLSVKSIANPTESVLKIWSRYGM